MRKGGSVNSRIIRYSVAIRGLLSTLGLSGGTFACGHPVRGLLCEHAFDNKTQCTRLITSPCQESEPFGPATHHPHHAPIAEYSEPGSD